ncbi:hypothetical protein BSNK01_04280 [Bacillaceae bacterium]
MPMHFQPDALRRLEDIKREMDRLLTTGLPSLIAGGMDAVIGFPRVDVYETENEIVAVCDLPGLKNKENLNIDIDEHVLTISGELKRGEEIREEQVHRRERFSGRFRRSVSLPAAVSPDRIRATYKNGVLEIRMPKKETKRRIDVEFQ